jgi:O-antigen biosynthesis protein
VLYIDQYVPMCDKDAGSFITTEYLKILINLGCKIIFWPDNLLPLEPYTNMFQQMGIEVVYGNLSFTKYIKKYGKYIDVACVSRPHIAVAYLDKIVRYSKAKTIYIPHDLNFLREGRRAVIEQNKGILPVVESWKSKELSLMQKCDKTLVFSEKELKTVRKIDSTITISVAPWVQDVNGSSNKAINERKNIVFLGGFAHPPNEDGVLWFTEKVFPVILKQLPGVRFVIAGSYPTKAIVALQSDHIFVTGFLADVSELFNNAKVFVAPLRYGAGLKGKIIHAMSYGMPVVTTRIGAEGLHLKDGENAMIADDPLQFANKVLEVYTDKSRWICMSRASLSHVEKNYSPTMAKTFFHGLLSDISPRYKTMRTLATPGLAEE